MDTIAYEGGGDFCLAYTVNDRWIFRFAHNAEGSGSLEREARLLPRLAPRLCLAIPDIRYFEWRSDNGLAFVGYLRIPGAPLTRELLHSLQPREREECAHDLADFLSGLHSFRVKAAQESGVVAADYPFSRTEEGILEGSADQVYRRELHRLLSYPNLDEGARRFCTQLVERILDGQRDAILPAALIHGDLSQDHVLFDHDTNRITGIIDFTDTIISTPLLDLVYLYHAYDQRFFEHLLSYYCSEQKIDPHRIADQVRLLHRWYVALRLLWALDHNYEPGIEIRCRELRSLSSPF